MNMSIIAASMLRIDNRSFIIEIDTTKAGSGSSQFQFTGAQGSYNVEAIKIGGTQFPEFYNDLIGEQTINLPTSGIYRLSITASLLNSFTGLRFNNSGDKLKLLKINQFGLFKDTRTNLFFGCSNLNELGEDGNYLNSITDGTNLFKDCALTVIPTIVKFSTLTNGTGILEGNRIETESVSKLYIRMEGANSNSSVLFNAGDSKYNTEGETAKDLLIADHSWSFIDGGLE